MTTLMRRIGLLFGLALTVAACAGSTDESEGDEGDVASQSDAVKKKPRRLWGDDTGGDDESGLKHNCARCSRNSECASGFCELQGSRSVCYSRNATGACG
jgi:hypothetical protein